MAGGGGQGLRVFLSYRRQDMPGYAGRLYDDLVEHLGRDGVFWDIDTIRPGSDFTNVIHDALDRCDVLLALIGPNWLSVTGEDGRRRLDDPDDFVRREVGAALERGVPVLPVLVHRADMPAADELPAPLADLARRQAFDLSDRRWDDDLDDLVAELERLRQGDPAAPAPPAPAPPPPDGAVVPPRAGGVVAPAEPVAAPSPPPPAVGEVAAPGARPWPSGLRLGAAAAAGLALVAGVVVVTQSGGGPLLDDPTGVAVAADGTLYVTDRLNHRVRRVLADASVEDFAGGGKQRESYGEGGPAAKAELAGPWGVAEAAGSIYVADADHAIVWQVNSRGTLLRAAGTGSGGFDGDGGPATAAQLLAPTGIAVDGNGVLYIADTANHRIRKVEGNRISTFAGTGEAGSDIEGKRPAEAGLNEPEGIAVASDGSVFIADTGNHRILHVDGGGTISVLAGDGEARFRGEGEPAATASLNRPSGLAVTNRGLYIADQGNHRIRVIDPELVISTVAGNGDAGFDGDGEDATRASLREPRGVAVGGDGVVYVADTGNDHIRRIADGVITTVT